MSAELVDRMSTGSADGKAGVDEEQGLLADLRAHRSYQATLSAAETLADNNNKEKEGESLHLHASAEPEMGVIRTALMGVKKNAIPGVVIQIMSLAMVLGFYYYAPITTAFGYVATLKANTGYVFSAISTATFGGIIPWIVISFQAWRAHKNAGMTLSLNRVLLDGVFLTALFVERGIEVDAFYRLQAWMFGSGADIYTLAAKVFVDEFVYGPLWATPLYAIVFTIKDNDFSIIQTFRNWSWKNFQFRYVGGILSTWLIWLPVCCLVYALPGALQVPLFNLVLCFYTLLLVFINSKNPAPPPSDEEEAVDHQLLDNPEKVRVPEA